MESKKARGLYDKFSNENKELYESIMKKSYIDDLAKLTKKELAYLTDLYERKVKELKTSGVTEYDEKDVLTVVMSIKLKAAVARRNIVLSQYRYNKNNQLTTEQKQEARNKLNKLCRA